MNATYTSNHSEESHPEKPEEDLEDGEIEDDEEEAASQEISEAEPPKIDEIPDGLPPSIVEPAKMPALVEMVNKPESNMIMTEKNEKHKDRSERDRRRHEEKVRRGEEKGHRHMTEAEKSILHLRKKEKLMREREKWEKARRKETGLVDPMDDDFAKNIEKTLATILSKKEKEAAAAVSGEEDKDVEKRAKKRKHHEKDRYKNKQRRGNDSPKSEIDENEMLNIRGGSPPEQRINDKRSRSPSRSDESYDSEYSTDQSKNDERNRKKDTRREKRKTRDHRERNRREREKRNEPKMQMQDSQGVCVFYLQGKCQKNDCPYSHEANPPMKLELCKFYLMDCCAKGEKCSYMHSEFPCKFYHTGLQCTKGEDCKFAHGAPLSEGLKQILFKHIETAPRDILGGFPRMSREEALNLINDTQLKLHAEHYGPSSMTQSQSDQEGVAKGGIPSLFDISVPVPPELNQGIDELKPLDKKEKTARKRASRWQDPDPSQNFSLKPFQYGQDQDMRINSNGDIDMRTLPTLPVIPNMPPSTPNSTREVALDSQELSGFTAENASPSQHSQTQQHSQTMQDTDIRSTNLLTSFNTKDVDIRQQTIDSRFLPSMDVDIRQIPGIAVGVSKESETEDEPMLEIDTGEDETAIPPQKQMTELPNTAAHLFARIQAQQKDDAETNANRSEERFDLDVADINWYSDDDDDEDDNRLTIKVEEEDKGPRDKEEFEESQGDFSMSQRLDSMSPPQIKPIDVVSKLGDLSKIDISAEVTKLLTSMSQNRNSLPMPATEIKIEAAPSSTPPHSSRSVRQDPRTGLSVTAFQVQESSRSLDPRLNVVDPRQRPRQSSIETRTDERKPQKMSIYEQGGIDMNLKNLKAAEELENEDFKSSLRPDIDLRNLTLPFKGMQNYTPATEIDASVNSHPPIHWRIVNVEVPRPDYTGLKLSINDAEKTGDPRLRKIFRLSVDEKDSPMSPKASPRASTVTRVDPRLKKSEEKSDAQMNYVQQLNLLQSSVFYQSLTSNQKLMLNQELSMRADQSGTNDPVLHSLLSNLNLVSGTGLPGAPTVSSALSILANVTNMNQILGPTPTPGMVMQPGLLGAAPGIPNVVPPDFAGMGFDPRNGGLLGNVPPPAFGGNFPQIEGQFPNFGPPGGVGGDEFYPQNENFGHGNRGNRDFNSGGNRDNRRRGRNYNGGRNNNRNNFRNNSNRNSHNRTNRNHSPP